MLFHQVPTPGAHHNGGWLVSDLVMLAFGRRELDRAVKGVAQVELALDHVLPSRGIGVLEVGQPDIGA